MQNRIIAYVVLASVLIGYIKLSRPKYDPTEVRARQILFEMRQLESERQHGLVSDEEAAQRLLKLSIRSQMLNMERSLD